MNLAFLNIGSQEMIFIVIIILLLFGGKKLPELARGLGKGIREFKDASDGIKREISDQINNFEKELDAPDTYSSTSNTNNVAEVTAVEEQTPEEAQVAEKKEQPKFTAPEGTYQHQPGREPDYNDQNYYQYGYNDHFANQTPNDTSDDVKNEDSPSSNGDSENNQSLKS